MKKVVGVLPLWDDKKESIWMLPGYLEGLRSAGLLPVILPLSDDREELKRLVDMCGGFLFTGGHDVSPQLYGEEPLKDLTDCCPLRDRMDKIVLETALERNKPVLGICRGLQLINVVMGGSLYQDLPLQHPSPVEHHQKAPYDVPSHRVSLIKETPLYEALKRDTLEVNSCHHQGIKELAKGLASAAVAEDGLIEAVYKPDARFLLAVQWHPEFSYLKEEASRRIFAALAKAME